MAKETKNKFRFWSNRDKKFIEPYKVKFKKDGSISKNWDIEISQSSGLVDCTNTEIFEGDFLEDENGEIYEVRWYHLDDAQGFIINSDDWHKKIIGNIYQTDFSIKYTFQDGWFILNKKGNSIFGSVPNRINAEYQKEGLDNIEIEKRLNMLCSYKSGVTREIIVK